MPSFSRTSRRRAAAMLALHAVAASAPATVVAQAAASTAGAGARTPEARVDSIFAPYARPDAPGCAVAVARDGRTVLARGYGAADLEHGIPISPRTVFYVGSVSKQFTAMSILLLAERGALSLDDDVRKWVPEVPDHGARITIRHLLHHTSGLRDYLTTQGLTGHAPDALMTEADFLELVSRQRGLNFRPGDEYRYSNTGYVLLSIVAKRASGKSLREVAEEGIFRPLGMADTRFRDDHRELVPRRAHGYVPADAGWRLATPMSDLVGGGGVFSTVEDLLRWAADFTDGRVGSRETRALQLTPGRLNDGRTLTYAAGLQLGALDGHPVVEHGGSLAGYRAHVLRVPDQRVAVATLCNLSRVDAGALTRGAARAYLSGVPRVAAVRAAGAEAGGPGAGADSAPAWRPDAGELARYAGTFVSDELAVTWTLVAEGDRLLLRRPRFADVPLRPTARRTFAFGSTTLRFAADGERADAFSVHAGRAEGMRFERRRP